MFSQLFFSEHIFCLVMYVIFLVFLYAWLLLNVLILQHFSAQLFHEALNYLFYVSAFNVLPQISLDLETVVTFITST